MNSVSLGALISRLPERRAAGVDIDAVLSGFLEYVGSIGRELYPAQEEAVLEIFSGKHVILNTPTGSGKSLVAAAVHFKAMAEGRRSFYTSPIKALASEKFFALCQEFGAENVGMMTGDAGINRHAPIVCCTAEVLANIALGNGDDAGLDYVIMDEFHYYSDRDRGVAWEVPLLTLPTSCFLLMSATIGNAEFFQKRIEELTARPVALVRSEQRPVPLDYVYSEEPLHEAIGRLVESGKTPVYLVNFTQRACAEEAQNLMSSNYCSKEEKQAIAEALIGVRFDSPYGKELQKFVRHGIGLHHAGLLPKYRLLVEKLAQRGLLKVICGTDTLGVGINVPIRTVLFTQLCKYDGEKTAILSVRDFRQISGRAGRKGFDSQGTVVVQAPAHVIENLRLEAKITADGKNKKGFVRRKPPEKGYVHWDRETFERLRTRAPEALVSRFRVSHGMLLNLLQGRAGGRHGGYGALLALVDRSGLEPKQKRQERSAARALFKSLRAGGVVELRHRGGAKGSEVVLAASLGDDFTMHHALSLYVLETLERFPPEAELETHAEDVLSLIEAIVEDPAVVLAKQLDKIKQERLAELKAQGAEYEERVAELEKLEYPKPLREFLYATFDEFSAKHPWVAGHSVRPKSVAREMWERLDTFDNYVVEYGLQRSEGVLLRYLSDAYKALVQAVPEARKTERVYEIESFLRTTIRRVDSSLVDEWESLQSDVRVQRALEAERARGDVSDEQTPRKPRDLAEDPRALGARVRSEIGRFLRRLAARDFEGALGELRSSEDAGTRAWTAEDLESALAPYFKEYGRVRTDNASRAPKFTRMSHAEGRTWLVRQTLVDPQEDNFWYADFEVVVPEHGDPAEPIVALMDIGA